MPDHDVQKALGEYGQELSLVEHRILKPHMPGGVRKPFDSAPIRARPKAYQGPRRASRMN